MATQSLFKICVLGQHTVYSNYVLSQWKVKARLAISRKKRRSATFAARVADYGRFRQRARYTHCSGAHRGRHTGCWPLRTSRESHSPCAQVVAPMPRNKGTIFLEEAAGDWEVRRLALGESRVHRESLPMIIQDTWVKTVWRQGNWCWWLVPLAKVSENVGEWSQCGSHWCSQCSNDRLGVCDRSQLQGIRWQDTTSYCRYS